MVKPGEAGELVLLEPRGPKHGWLCGGIGEFVPFDSPDRRHYEATIGMKAGMIGHSGNPYAALLRGAKLMYDSFAGQKFLYKCRSCRQLFRSRPGG